MKKTGNFIFKSGKSVVNVPINKDGFSLLFSMSVYPLFLRLLGRKWNIYKCKSDKNKTCLSVGHFGICRRCL